MSEAMFCRKCGYSLQHIDSRACPECGQPFDPTDPKTYVEHVQTTRVIHLLIGAGILWAMVFWVVWSTGDVFMYIDTPSAIWLIGILTGGLWMCFGPGPVIEALGKAIIGYRECEPHKLAMHLMVLGRAYQLSWGAGMTGMLFGVVVMLQNMADPVKIGPGMAYALMPVLYAAVLAEFGFSLLQQILISRSGVDRTRMPWITMPQRSMQFLGIAVVFMLITAYLILAMGRF